MTVLSSVKERATGAGNEDNFFLAFMQGIDYQQWAGFMLLPIPLHSFDVCAGTLDSERRTVSPRGPTIVMVYVVRPGRFYVNCSYQGPYLF